MISLQRLRYLVFVSNVCMVKIERAMGERLQPVCDAIPPDGMRRASQDETACMPIGMCPMDMSLPGRFHLVLRVPHS